MLFKGHYKYITYITHLILLNGRGKLIHAQDYLPEVTQTVSVKDII